MIQHSPFLKKEAGRYVRNAVMREIQKNSKNPFAVHNSIFHFSKQFLIQNKQRKWIESIS